MSIEVMDKIKSDSVAIEVGFPYFRGVLLIVQTFELPKIPGLLLMACYLGNKNPESTDKEIFKANTNKSSNAVILFLTFQKRQLTRDPKTPNIHRILFMFQYLFNLWAELNDFDNSYEFSVRNQSVDFYSSFKLLEELKLIKRLHFNINEFENPKFECLCERALMNSIANSLGIPLTDYLGQSQN